jgi:aspartate aminotransferase
MVASGFDAFRYAHEHRNEIAWLSQNTNHLVPPEVIRPALQEAIQERLYEGYPYAPGLLGLKEQVLADLGLPAELGVVVSAGATEALYMATRALIRPGDQVLASDPSYFIIHRFVELSGGRTEELEIYAPPYRLTPDRVRDSLTDRTRMILLIDPLNPLGSGYPPDDVRAIAEIAHDRHLLLLNDVTYRDFSERHTLAHPFYPDGTLTAWSVSKNCGMAGLRLGGIVGPRELVAQVARFNTNDLGVNILAQVAALAALRSKPKWLSAVLRTTRENQHRIRSAVQSVPGTLLPVFPSQANMFAIDLSATQISPDALQRELLLEHGVFVRAGNYLSSKFGERFVRVSFSNPPTDIERFVRAFPAAVEKLRPAVSAPTSAATRAPTSAAPGRR